MHILIVLLVGLIVGALARFIVPGTEPGGWIVSMILGVIGSMLGTGVGRGLGMYRHGETAGFFMSLVGALVVVAIYPAISTRRTSGSGRTGPRPT